jgi:hypothetical protein
VDAGVTTIEEVCVEIALIGKDDVALKYMPLE